jgi:hypothetical protein
MTTKAATAANGTTTPHKNTKGTGGPSSSATTATTTTSTTTKHTVAPPNNSSSSTAWYYHVIWNTILVYMIYVALRQAYTIRLRAISEYGPVIHEFDPYFNYRATEVRIDFTVLLLLLLRRMNCCSGDFFFKTDTFFPLTFTHHFPLYIYIYI